MISARSIAEVKERTDIVAVVSEHVPSLKLRGRSYSGLCPFHAEKSPSFHVNRERGFYHCFGCKESGSAIDFLMKIMGLSFPEAVRDLAERIGVTVEDERSPQDRADYDRKRRELQDLHAVMNLAATFYEIQLREHADRHYAHDELAARGLDADVLEAQDPQGAARIRDSLQAFRMGYAPAAWDSLAQYLRAQGVSPVEAERAGLLLPRSSGSGYYDRFRHRLMFAVCDVHGRVVAFSGRALREHPAQQGGSGEKPAKYINSPETPIYTKGQEVFGVFQGRHAIRAAGMAVVVEGNFDVVALHARGMQNVVAPLGTAFTVEQAKLLKRFAGHVTLLFDGDAAGQKAVAAAREPLRAVGLPAKVALLPDGQDPDSLVRARGIGALGSLMQAARGLRETLLERDLDERFAQADVFEKKARIERVVKLLAEEDDPLVRATLKSLTDQLASRFDIRGSEAFQALQRAVRDEFAKHVASQPAPRPGPPPASARVAPRPPGSAERRAIIEALLDFPALLDLEEIEEALGLVEGQAARLVLALRRHSRDGEVVDGAAFVDAVPEEFRPFVRARLANPGSAKIEEAKRQVLANAEKLKSRLSQQQVGEMSRRQRDIEDDWEAQKDLLQKATERAAEAEKARRRWGQG